MNVARSLFRYITDPDYRFIFNAGKGLYRNMPDEDFLRKRFHAAQGYYMDFDDPKTFSEKLQWLKINDHAPLYTKLADKAEVKKYIEEKIGHQYVIPTLAVWSSASDIDLDGLPDRFVLKCTHDSHGVMICDDKSKADIRQIRSRFRKALAADYYIKFREWPYKNIKPRVIAEEFISDNGKELADYKIHCFNGEPRMILVCEGRFSEDGLTEDFYDCEWKRLDVRRPKVPNAKKPHERPEQLDEMLEISRKLAGDIPFVRVDLYLSGEKVLFGEMTFYPASGFTPFVPPEWDMTIGSWLELPKCMKG